MRDVVEALVSPGISGLIWKVGTRKPDLSRTHSRVHERFDDIPHVSRAFLQRNTREQRACPRHGDVDDRAEEQEEREREKAAFHDGTIAGRP